MKKSKVSKAIFQSLNSYFSRLPSGNRQTIGGQVIHNSNSGFAFVLIIIAVVLIFSIALVSGADKFTLSEEKPPTSSRGGTGSGPTATPSATIAPSATITPSQWSMEVSNIKCESSGAIGFLETTGTSNGYVLIEVNSSGSSFQTVETKPFLPPKSFFNLNLNNSYGFSAAQWRISIFDGGTNNGADVWSGGTQRTSSQQNPTGC